MFEQYEAIMSDAIDSVFGERIRIEPQRGGDLVKGGPDPDRTPIEITGIIDISPELVNVSGGKHGALATVAADRIDVSFVSSAVPYLLRGGDRLVVLARSAVLGVDAVQSDGLGRTVLVCRLARA